MKLVIEVPVEVDGQLSDQELAKLRRHLRLGIPVMVEQLGRTVFNPEPRMYGATCRFRLARPQIRVEEES